MDNRGLLHTKFTGLSIRYDKTIKNYSSDRQMQDRRKDVALSESSEHEAGFNRRILYSQERAEGEAAELPSMGLIETILIEVIRNRFHHLVAVGVLKIPLRQAVGPSLDGVPKPRTLKLLKRTLQHPPPQVVVDSVLALLGFL